jgi:hypothetical protein
MADDNPFTDSDSSGPDRAGGQDSYDSLDDIPKRYDLDDRRELIEDLNTPWILSEDVRFVCYFRCGGRAARGPSPFFSVLFLTPISSVFFFSSGP